MKKKRSLRFRIICIAVAAAILIGAIVLIVVLANRKPEGTLAEASVVRASLSSNLSSTGLVKNMEFSTAIPLAALVFEDLETLGEIKENDYTVNLVKMLSDGSQGPILYRVTDVAQEYIGKEHTHDTADENHMIIELAPLYFDWDAAATHYAQASLNGTTEAQNVKEYVISLLLREGFSDVDPTAFPSEFWMVKEEEAVTVDTDRIGDMILKELEHVESVEFTISKMTWKKGDAVLLDDKLFTVTYSELFASFALSEYDVSGINARMLEGERVYASVGINALSGRSLIAEIVKIEGKGQSSGISYFTLLGRLVFPHIEKDPNGNLHSSYTYYDEFLTDTTVSYLGVGLTDNLTREDVLDNYSITVSAQKTVVEDTLIVPTKCIYYDDAKRPYVAVLDAEKKEKRVYIKITLSTGVDAAVTAADGYTLNEGDVLRYIASASLIGSLF